MRKFKNKIKKFRKMLESSTVSVEYVGSVDQPKGLRFGRGYYESFAFSSECIHGLWYFPGGIFRRRYLSFVTIESVEKEMGKNEGLEGDGQEEKST